MNKTKRKEFNLDTLQACMDLIKKNEYLRILTIMQNMEIKNQNNGSFNMDSKDWLILKNKIEDLLKEFKED